jgi:hypothetical protein
VSEVCLRVEGPHFVAGVVAVDGKIVRAAPILRYMIGWDGKRFRNYHAEQGWTWQPALVDDGALTGSPVDPA